MRSASLRYKILPTNLIAWNYPFIFFIHPIRAETVYYEAQFLPYRPQTECSYCISQFCKTNCTHSIFISGRSKHAWAFSESVKKFPKSPVTASRFSLLTSAKFELRPVKCLHINRVTFQHNKEFMFIFYLLVL